MNGPKMITVHLTHPKTKEKLTFRIRDYVELKNGSPYYIVSHKQITRGLKIERIHELVSQRCEELQILILDKQQTLFGIPCEQSSVQHD